MQMTVETQAAPPQAPAALADDQDWLRIRNSIMLQMQKSGVAWLHRTKVTLSNEGVTLRGRVRSYYERQLCIAAVRRIAPQANLIDLLEVDVPSVPVIRLAS